MPTIWIAQGMEAIPPQFLAWAVPAGWAVMLPTAIFALFTDRLVPGPRVAKIESELVYWRTTAITLLGQQGQLLPAVELISTALEGAGEHPGDETP